MHYIEYQNISAILRSDYIIKQIKIMTYIYQTPNQKPETMSTSKLFFFKQKTAYELGM